MFTHIFYSILYQKFLSVQQKKEKKLKDIQIVTDEVKLFFFADNMTAYVENPNPNPQKKKVLGLVNEFQQGYMIQGQYIKINCIPILETNNWKMNVNSNKISNSIRKHEMWGNIKYSELHKCNA